MLGVAAVVGLFWTALTLAAPLPAANTFVVSSSGGNITSPYAYGIMFEDINHALDGGLYAELIANRAFQAANFSAATVDPWYSVGGSILSLETFEPLSAALPYSVKVATGGAKGKVGLANPGWHGIPVIPQVYSGSFQVRGPYQGSLTIALVSTTEPGTTFASTDIPVSAHADVWTEVTYQLTPPAAAPNVNNSLSITFDAATATVGSLNFNLISLFPPTYNSRPNGMRIDLMQTLGGLNPSFLRWGGNNIEGNPSANNSPRWVWNNTIGPIINRPGRQGTWGYYNTDGVGLNEVFEWAQDLDMEMILTLWDGHYLDNSSLSEPDLQPYIQDSLNELEYVLGSVDTKYGALRSSHGYPDPWKLNYVEIGNEDNLSDGLPTYTAYRFEDYAKAIQAAYPDLNIMASTLNVTRSANELGDYHQYSIPDVFVQDYDFFDQFDPAGSKVLIGEYANVQPNGIVVPPHGADFSLPLSPAPEWIGSVAEAVYLIGAERNGGKVWGAAYAPTFVNLDYPKDTAWSVDLVGFTSDPNVGVKSTSYHVIDLLSGTRFTTTRAVSTIEQAGPLYWVAGENTPTGQQVFKAAVYNSTGNVPVTVQFDGLAAGVKANLTILTGTGATASNALGQPQAVITNISMLTSTAAGFSFSLPDLSVAVLSTFPSNSPDSTYATELVKSGFGGYTGCSLGRSIVPSWGNGC